MMSMIEQPRMAEILPKKTTTVEEMRARVMELRKRTSFLLASDPEHYAEMYEPDAIKTLSPEDRRLAAMTYGRLLALYADKNDFSEWAEKITGECTALAERSSDPERMQPIIGKITDFSEFLMAGNVNTNSARSGVERQSAMRHHLANIFSEIGDMEARDEIYNPFHLKSGEVLFRPVSESRWEFSLEEVSVGDVAFAGKDSTVEIAGKIVPLSDVNYQLVSKRLMLRDGSNVLGNPEYRAFPRLESGEKIKIKFKPMPGQQDNAHVVEFLGTNEEELRERCGNAYLPFIGRLLVVRFVFEGKEVDFPFSEILEIGPAEA